MTTITPDDLHKAADHCHIDRHKAHLLAATLGITIAPPAASEAMVKLAREIARNAPDALLAGYGAADGIALAALQHVEKLALDADSPATCDGIPLIMRTNILTAIGSNRHD
jgi:hypothetical protein